MKKYLLSLLLLLSYQNILAAQTIKFAMEATYPPFESVAASGQMVGFDVDIANALCAKMKATCTFSNQPWDSLIPSLNLGKFDAIISAMAITSEREKIVDFTNPYYTNTGSLIASNTEKLSLSKEGLKGKTIGVQGGTTFEFYLRKTYGEDITVKNYASLQNAFLDLKAGRIDGVLGDTPILLEWQKQDQHSKHYQIIGKAIDDPKYIGVGDGIAVKKGNKVLLQALNKALAEIKADGTHNKIQEKYFGK